MVSMQPGITDFDDHEKVDWILHNEPGKTEVTVPGG